jgi:AcrR family transcriptional regulator
MATRAISNPTAVSGGLERQRRSSKVRGANTIDDLLHVDVVNIRITRDVDGVNTAPYDEAMSAPKRTGPTPPRPYHHGNLRRALLDEALATIRTEGVEALTLREIGARLGVSRTALYRHFADKQALLTAVATEGFRTLRQELVAAWEKGGRGDSAFSRMGAAYVGFAVANPSHYRVMFGGVVEQEGRDPELAAEAEGAFQALVEALTTLQREGILRRDDPVLMATYVWSLVHGMGMLAIDGQLRQPGGVDALMRYALERLRTGIGNPGPTPPSPR